MQRHLFSCPCLLESTADTLTGFIVLLLLHSSLGLYCSCENLLYFYM